MSDAKFLLELTPKGMDVIRELRRTEDESPEDVIMRALTMMRAVRKYMEDDSLTVMNPNTADDNDLIRLRFKTPIH
jgi:hypothetical protein